MILSDQERRIIEFRITLEDRGYLVNWLDIPDRKLHPVMILLDLNQGTIVCNLTDLSFVYALAQEFAASSDYGEHVAIRQLIVSIEELDQAVKQGYGLVYAHRPYHVSSNNNKAMWITLKEIMEKFPNG